MNRRWTAGIFVALIGFCTNVCGPANGAEQFSSSATAHPETNFHFGDSPNSTFVSSGNASSFSTSQPLLVRGWVNDGDASKVTDAYYLDTLTPLEFFNKYGVGLSGPLDVTAFYKISNHGPALGGVSAGLRIMSGGTSDDTVSRSGVSTSEGGPLFVHLDSVGFLPLTIRIIGHASAGGDTFGGFSVAITEIKVNNQVVFTGPEPPDPFVPEPASSVLAALAVIGAAMIRRR